jgi:DNA repair protein RadD
VLRLIGPIWSFRDVRSTLYCPIDEPRPGVHLRFEDLLGRADVAALQRLLGTAVVRLLAALSPTGSEPVHLRRVLLELTPPAELLLAKETRRILMDLLRKDEAVALIDQIRGTATSDPFPQLIDLSVRRGTKTSALLLSFFGLAEPLRLERRTVAPTSASGGYELFPHQRSAVRKAAPLLAGGARRVLLHMPTGSGKTRTAMSLAATHLRADEPRVVLWLAASEELCDQAAAEFCLAWGKLGDRTLEVRRWWGAENLDEAPPKDGFIVAGLAKIYARAIDSPPWLAGLGDRVSLIIFDEAHQAIAPTYRHVVEGLLARREDCALLGLTATPGRTWNDVSEDEELSGFFARQKVTLEVMGFANVVEYLVREGYLAKPEYRCIEHTGPDITDDERVKIAKQLELPDSVLNRLADDHYRNVQIAFEVRKLAHEHKRILVFSATVRHAELLAVVLRSMGISARAVTASTPSDERADLIQWYRQVGDEPRVLTNYGVLTTGFDAPQTSAAVIARPTKSLVLYSQMVGRAIRGKRVGGNSTAVIVTVVDTELPGFRSLAEAFSNWEDVWRQ